MNTAALLVGGICLGLAADEDFKTGYVPDLAWWAEFAVGGVLFLLSPFNIVQIAFLGVTVAVLWGLMRAGLLGPGDYWLLIGLQFLAPYAIRNVPLALAAFMLGSVTAWLANGNKEVRLVPYLLWGYGLALCFFLI